MTYHPFQDKKFLTATIDAIVFLALYFAGKYAPASLFDDIKTVFAVVQPLVLIYIGNLFMAENALMRGGNTLNFLYPKNFPPR
jgi:hypothetical protein